jgi:lipopolysaccharide transport system ATP-binding protein
MSSNNGILNGSGPDLGAPASEETSSQPIFTPHSVPTSQIAISVRNLSKKYSIVRNQTKHATLAETLLHRMKSPLKRPERDEFWALRDVNFDIHSGEVVGIIGRNGAGKSTLLKVMSQITEPTLGEIEIYGRIGSLLEVGTGFHPELTGRENIYLNGSILGMTKREIDKSFDEIVAFSGVERFLETPVKRFSSGMYIRLAFAVAAHLSTEILVVDEVLAVGDIEFQRRCLGKMKDVADSGRTVLFVSHSMQAISKLCTRAILMQAGHVEFEGAVDEGIERYLNMSALPTEADQLQRRHGTGQYRFESITPSKIIFTTDEEKSFDFVIKKHGEDLSRLILWVDIVDDNEVVIAHLDSRLDGVSPQDAKEIRGHFSFTTPWLKPGNYRVDATIRANGQIDKFEHACAFEISPVLPYAYAVKAYSMDTSLVLADAHWEAEEIH